MGKEIDAIMLDGCPGARSYLIHCSNTDHIRTTGNPVDFFLSSTLNTGSIRLCQKCYSAKRNQLRKDNRRQQNLNQQIQPGSHCPISTLSLRHLKMRYDNMREELLTLKHTCTSLNRKLETLLHIEEEEILEEKDPNGYELVRKVSKFINENTNNAYQSIFTAIMENMCKSNTEKHMVLSDEERKQCGDFASVILEQMQSNAKKITKNEKGVRFSPRILRMALSIYTRSKVGYEEMRKASVEVMPSPATLNRLKSKMKTTDGTCPITYQWFFDDTVCKIPELERAGHLMCDEMHLKSGIYWNTQSHTLVGFASDSEQLNLADELHALNDVLEGTEINILETQTKIQSFENKNSNAKKVNQWRFCSIKGVIHNTEYFFNSGSLTGDELLRQFVHVVSCYEAIGVRILGCVSDAGGQNSRLFSYLRCFRPIDEGSWLSDDSILIQNPAVPSRNIALWFCTTHQLKNMRNALLNTASTMSKRAFINDGTPMTWQIIEETYKADCRLSSPITSLTKSSVFPDGWNKMNVSAAKAPFLFDTISAMMMNVAVALDCSDENFMTDIMNHDIPTIYKDRLSILRLYQNLYGDAITATKIRTVEYCVHVAIIFNETLMNRNVYIDSKNILKHESNLRQSLKFFEDWKNSCTNSTDANNNFLPMITYNNLRIAVCGFLAYTRMVVLDGVIQTGIKIFVPALHSNTSSLELWFSLVRSMLKDNTRAYATAVSTQNAASSVVTIKGTRNKSYSALDVAEQQDQEQTMLERALCRNDTMREKKVNEKVHSYTIVSCCHDEKSWNPFLWSEDDEVGSVLDCSYTCRDRKRHKIATDLCHQIICSEFVGISCLTDMLCSTRFFDYHNIQETYTVYCRMSIRTTSESMLMTLFDFDATEKAAFDRACRSVLRIILNIVYIELLQKNNSKTIESFYCLIYTKFLSKLEKYYGEWISILPKRMIAKGECGASLVIEILIQLFRILFFCGVDLVCKTYRYQNQTSENQQRLLPANDDAGDVDIDMAEDSSNVEVQRFFVWAIKEGIDFWKEKVNKEQLISGDEGNDNESDSYKCLTLMRSMRCFHNDIMFDPEYVAECYPLSVAARNRGWLCLVAKPYFSLGKQLLSKIRSDKTFQKLMNGDHDAIKDLYESLANDDNFIQEFTTITENTGYGNDLTDKRKKELWNYLLTKTYHSRIGVVTDHFAEATTGRYAATARTDTLRVELKIKTRQRTVEKAKNKGK